MWINYIIPAKSGKTGKVVCVGFAGPVVSKGNYKPVTDQCKRLKGLAM